ncbi:hypothetical protein L3C95_21375 [Chitinophaga filiformis]|uniref:hypothetical protein n=1 Tax=Chitinophaga filiformis TaxID=104663 RepID=UPI001F248D62|nr:hypothetical protein [Chitinophaga filiformis]MCF6405469.1 hypothetical protein [Chitinophaga filiformis]
MKYITSIFFIGIIVFFISCGQSTGTKTSVPVKADSMTTSIPKIEPEQGESSARLTALERADSIRFDSVLQEAVRMAAAKQKDTFSMQYVVTLPDSSGQVDVDLSSNLFFTKEHPHLVVRRYAGGSIYTNIFFKTGKGLQQVLASELATVVHMGDTILDVNGDHLKDFVVNGYSANGCCLKGFSIVYLLRQDMRSFSEGFHFINPTFSPKEHMIRGICYGHPGETEMYKYRWNGEAVDTVEYIYYERNDNGKKTGKIIVSNNEPDRDNHKVLRRLSVMPAEYEKIEGYDWFIGF